MKKRLFSSIILLGGLLMPLLSDHAVYADEVAELKTVSNEGKRPQVDIDQQDLEQVTVDRKVINNDQKEIKKPSQDKLKNIKKFQVDELKSNRTKKFKYHKRNVDKVNKTLTKYH